MRTPTGLHAETVPKITRKLRDPEQPAQFVEKTVYYMLNFSVTL